MNKKTKNYKIGMDGDWSLEDWNKGNKGVRNKKVRVKLNLATNHDKA